MVRRHAVPDLWCPIVEVVDPIQVHVLDVPRERGLPHAKVEVSPILHPGQSLTKVIEQISILAFVYVPDFPILI